MRVICTSNKRADLTLDTCKQYAQERADEIIVGELYTVYGQCLSQCCLQYLIDPVSLSSPQSPNWYPAEWFSVVDNSIHPTWVFKYDSEAKGHIPIAIWGYPELIHQDHFEGLIERDEKAIRLFLERAGEIDRTQNENSPRFSEY